MSASGGIFAVRFKPLRAKRAAARAKRASFADKPAQAKAQNSESVIKKTGCGRASAGEAARVKICGFLTDAKKSLIFDGFCCIMKQDEKAVLPHGGRGYMNNELKKTLRTIYDNTGIELFVYTAGGEPVSDLSRKRIAVDFDGIAQRDGNTRFKAVFKAEQYVFEMAGATGIEKNYAFMLADMIENSSNRAVNLPKGEYARRILLGECNASDIQKYRVKYSVPDLPCCCLALHTDGKISDVITLLSQYGENEADCAVTISGKDCAFIKFVESESEYQSSVDFASFLTRSLLEELGIRCRVGVGGTFRHFEEIGASYQQASAALRMSALFESKGEVHSYREFLLIKMLEDISKAKLSEYLSILLEGDARELLKDEEMVNTAEEFLENSLNASETSRNLYMHRNTLTYRLDKIERVMGLNLRKFSDAVTFRVITILNKLV